MRLRAKELKTRAAEAGVSVEQLADAISRDGLTASTDTIEPGQSVDVELVASDALWEKYRMTGLIHDPDSRFAGLIFYYDDNGTRYFQEVGGAVLPNFF